MLELVKDNKPNELNELRAWVNSEICSAHEDPTISDKIIDIVNANMQNLLDDIEGYIKENPQTSDISKTLLRTILSLISNLSEKKIISSINGTDDEWEDRTDPDDIGKILKINFRGQEVRIPIQSVQQNKRYTSIFRFNEDNNLAHNINSILYYNYRNQQQVITNDDSIRFIKFPYMPIPVGIPSMFNEDGSFFKELDLKDTIIKSPERIVFNNPYNHEDPVLAPKIPFNMLEHYGVDLNEEISEYLANTK